MFSFAVPDPLMPDPSKQPKNQLNPIGSLQVSRTVFPYLAFCLLKRRCLKLIISQGQGKELVFKDKMV